MKATFAPDTNFLEQFKQPCDLPWSEITAADEVELVLLTAVLRELDAHNHGPNGRRHRAAERVLKATLGLEIGKPVVLKEKNPRVFFSEPEVLPNQPDVPAWLDTSKPDEAILAEVLAYREGGRAELVLLTADRTLERLARRAGVPAVLAPDAWKLPPEPDPQAKKVEELERRMKSLEGRAPTIRVWPEVEEAEVETIVGTVQRFPPLSKAFIDNAMEAVEQAHPSSVPMTSGALSQGFDHTKYRKEWADWIERLRSFLEHVHLRLNVRHGLLPVVLCLENSGAAIATGFVVEVDAQGAFRFVDTENEAIEIALKSFGLPGPPTLKPLAMFGFDDGSRFAGIDIDRPFPTYDLAPRPDSPEFDWTHDGAVGDQVKGTCGQFRRGRRPECLELHLMVPVDADTGPEVQGRLYGWFTADNLAETGEFSFPVRLSVEWKSTEDAVAALLSSSLKVQLEQE